VRTPPEREREGKREGGSVEETVRNGEEGMEGGREEGFLPSSPRRNCPRRNKERHFTEST